VDKFKNAIGLVELAALIGLDEPPKGKLLEYEDLKSIVYKDKLEPEDIVQLLEYLVYISGLYQEYVEMPYDIEKSLHDDLSIIMNRLNYERINMKKPKLTLTEGKE
jgi:hypothetical protein